MMLQAATKVEGSDYELAQERKSLVDDNPINSLEKSRSRRERLRSAFFGLSLWGSHIRRIRQET